MANVNSPFGFLPVAGLSSQPTNLGVNTYSIPSSDGTALYIGDLVKLAGTGSVSTVDGYSYTDIIQAATGDTYIGVVVGFIPDPTDLTLRYRKASTARLVLVDDNPNNLYEVQEVGTGTAFTLNDVGLNCNIIGSPSGSTTTGLSGMMLDNATEATTNTLDVQIVGISNRTNNNVGAFCKWLVRINRHRYANQVAGT